MDPQDARKTIHPKVIAVLGGGLLPKWPFTATSRVSASVLWEATKVSTSSDVLQATTWRVDRPKPSASVCKGLA
jgi:hypothetical protein